MDSNQQIDFGEFLKHAIIWGGIGYASGSRGFNLAAWAALGPICEQVFGISLEDIALELERERLRKERQKKIARVQKNNTTPELQIASTDIPEQITAEVPKIQIPTYSKWQELIKHPAIVVVLGGRGSGKSATSYWVLEQFRYRLSPYVVRFPDSKKGLLPDWIGIAQRLEDVLPGSIAIVDEAYQPHHSREWQKTENINICQLLNLSRQQDKTIVFIAQQGLQLDIDIVSSADILIVKNPGMLQSKFDRPEFRDLLREAQRAFQSVKGDVERWSYVYSRDTSSARLMENDLPSFWSPALGTAYANTGNMASSTLPIRISDEEKMQKAKELYSQAKWSQGKIAEHFDVSKGTVFNWIHDYPYRK